MSLALATPTVNSSILANSLDKIPKVSSAGGKKELRKETNSFESLILKIILDTSMKDSKNIFSDKDKPGDRIYQSMYRDEIAKASSGSFGISQMLYNYLSKK